MQFYPEGYDVELTIPLVDKAGAQVVPVTVTALLYDGFGGLLVDLGALAFNPGDTSVTVYIIGQFNALSGEATREARMLEVKIATATAVVTVTHPYAIEDEQTLMVLTNTFQSYEAAELLSMEMVDATGWSTADETRRRAALAQAFNRITGIPMQYNFRDIDGEIDESSTYYIARDQWRDINLDAYALFPSHFKRALRMAQFLEADELLRGNLIASKHRAGIITETIGESSVTLRAGRVDYGLSTLAMRALAGYLHFSNRLARA